MKSRNRVGSILHISSSSGNLILRAERQVKIGENVANSKGKRIGQVFDIFGPVEAPFISVKTRIKDPEKLLGEDLFLGKEKRQ
jgi:RNA-binding protein